MRSLAWFSALVVLASGGRAAWGAPPQAAVDFNRDIRPILSKNCYACHGPDSGQRMAKLRLDERESALKKRKEGKPAIVPGLPEASELLWRISAADEARRMPPVERGGRLKPEQIV